MDLTTGKQPNYNRFNSFFMGMMDMNAHPIDTLQRLARIALSPQERETLGADLNRVFAWISELESVDIQEASHHTPPVMELRADNVQQQHTIDDVLQNAPAQRDHFFLVPKVLNV